jgi:lipoic acid synthetase
MSNPALDKSIPLQIVSPLVEGAKQVAGDKIARSPVKFDESAPTLRKPSWIRVRIPSGNAVQQLKSKLRARFAGDGVRGGLVPEHPRVLQPRHRHLHDPGRGLHPPLQFSATWPTAGPSRPTPVEPLKLAQTIKDMGLRTSWSPRSIATTCAMAARRISSECIRAGARVQPGAQDRDPDPGFSRQGPHGSRAGSLAPFPPGRVQPQPRNRARAVPRTCARGPTTTGR